MLKLVSSSFTSPVATATYTAADTVANHATAASVVPLSWHIGVHKGSHGGFLHHARILKTDETDVANATFSLWLFGASPLPAGGDDSALAPISDASFIKTLAFPIMIANLTQGVSSLAVGDTGFLNPVACPYATIYGLLEAKAAYTRPASEVFTVELTFEV